MNKIDINKLELLGIGSLSNVYKIDTEKVIVVGKREDSFSNYVSLMEKFKLIDGKITTIKYPKIFQIIEPNNQFEFGAMIEEYVSGLELKSVVSTLTKNKKIEIGKKLALFLNQLHSIKLNGNKQEEIEINTQKFDRSVALLSSYLTPQILSIIEKIKAKYIKLMESKDFCITHGDLHGGNILVSESGELNGIIDFGNMEYYIPEVEFAHMYFIDKIIYETMISNYNGQIDEKNVILLELVMAIRHFKNVIKFEDKVKNCLQRIEYLTTTYFSNL